MEKKSPSNFAKLFVSLVVCFAAAAIGSVFTLPSITTWYSALVRPFFTPPNWLFGPAWAILYFLMAIALFLVWRKGLGVKGVKKAMAIFAVQLVLNVLWSLAFFGLHSPMLGFAVIVLLWISILATILSFRKISVRAAWLLVPYICWVSFAACLNAVVWMLNP